MKFLGRTLTGRILVPAIAVGLAAAQSFGIDMGRSVSRMQMDGLWQSPDSTSVTADSTQSPDITAATADSVQTPDTVAQAEDTVAVILPRDTVVVPDSLKDTDPFKYKYYVALKDSLLRKDIRDSLLASGDTIEAHRLDSLYTKDSTDIATAKFNAWYNSLSKKEKRKYDYQQKLPQMLAASNAKLARKDSIKAARDSAIGATPRILETYAIPDSMQYKRMITWHHDREFNNIRLFDLDTSYNYHFYDQAPMKKDLNVNSLGVSGSASQSYSFFRREQAEDAIFYDAYQAYSYTPATLPMYNTKVPYTELAYWGTLLATDSKEESNIRIFTTQNILPELNVALEYNRNGGRGMLQNENTDNRTFVASTNYMGKRYLMHAGYIFNRNYRNENGGITDNAWIRDTLVDAKEISVALTNASSRIKQNTVFLDQSYRFPFSFIRDIGKNRKARREAAANADTTAITKGNGKPRAGGAPSGNGNTRAGGSPSANGNPSGNEVPADTLERDVTSAYIGHSTEYSVFTRTYNDEIATNDQVGRDFYNNNFLINPTTSADSMRVMRLDNKIYLRLQPWKADGIVSRLDVGVGDKLLHYYDYGQNGFLTGKFNTSLNSVYLYAGAQGQYKNYFTWDASGDYTFLGHEINDFGIKGNLTFSAYPFRRHRTSPLTLKAHFETSLREPDHYQQRLYTNHYRWENNFSKISTTRLEGTLTIPRWQLEARFGYALLSNNIYYDYDGIVRQNTTPMSVLSASLMKNFTLWKFHFDHRALFQLSSNEEVLPLPMLALNFRYYFQFDVVRNVMQMQLGANGFWNTRWYAPAYNPAVGVFHNQNEEMYGNCPYIDVFLNIQWKRACIFVKVENIGQGWPNDQADYFSAHHYINTQRALKFGIFWPFYLQPGSNSAVSGASGGGRSATGGMGTSSRSARSR